MDVGFIGLGKLGLPSALAIESKGHNVIGYDISDDVRRIVVNKQIPYKEAGAQELLENSNIKFKSMFEVLKDSEIIFVPVQTPHDPKYEGTTRLPETTKDFDYTYLKSACKAISETLDDLGQERIVVIISTAIPGAIEREIKPLLGKYVKLCYNPFFIAMGTTVHDFLNPEIVLFGVDDEIALEKVKDFYRTITDAPFHEMSIPNAELVKVNYNTFITMKINFANNLMEVCQKLRENGSNVDVDVVVDALADCTKRIISPTYMRGGMPDSGGCHPRDNIALADFAKKNNLSNDLYTEQMKIREHHIGWFKSIIDHHSRLTGLPKAIMGKAYKPESNLIVGSSSIRLYNEYKDCAENIKIWDPNVDGSNAEIVQELRTKPHVYFIGTQHESFKDFSFPQGSVIVDPFRYLPDMQGVKVVGLGK
jgi:UDPglucose 6-dehydrogenase